MSTHPDYDIADQTGSSLLTDLNDLLDALRSCSSDTVVPASFIDYQFWVDTTTNILKLKHPGGTLSICNIDTGVFFDVASTSDSDLLDGLATSTSATTNVILRRDANGAITGDMLSGDITGDAGALGAANQTPAYFFESFRLTGALPNTETAGDRLISSISLGGLTTTSGDQADYIYYRPLRTGVYKAKLWATDDEGTMYVMSTGDATQTTATITQRYYIANTGGVTNWTAVMTGASSVAVGDIYTCGTTSSDLDTDLTATGATVIPLTSWDMINGTIYSQNVTVNAGDKIIFDLTAVTGFTSDFIGICCNDYGWDTELTWGGGNYSTFATQQLQLKI
jgi:hypothetical protein